MNIPNPRIFILGLALLMIGANFWGFDIYILDEAKNAGCAREMWQRGDLIVPTFNDELRTDKPPFHYYFMMLAYSIFGVSPFSARLFSVIFGLLTVWVSMDFVKRYLGGKAAFWTGLTLACSIQVAVQFHLATPDPYLIFLLTLAQTQWFIAVLEGQKWRLYLSYVIFGLGVLAKGPVAIVVPGVALLLYLGLTGRLSWKGFLSVHPFRGILTAILVAAPWYIAVGLETDGAWLKGFFLDHNINRFNSEKEGHGGIFLITPAIFWIALLPFSMFLVQAFRKAWQVRREHELLAFAMSVVTAFVVFFSISQTKLPSYPAPAFPFGAMILGYWISQIHSTKSLRVSLWIWLLLSLVIVAGVAVGIRFDKALSDLSYLAVFFVSLPISAALGLFWILRKQQLHQGLMILAAGTFLAGQGFFYGAFPRVDRENPVQVVFSEVSPETDFIGYRKVNPAFVFNLQRSVPTFESLDSLRAQLRRNPDFYIISVKKYEDELKQIEGLEEVIRQRDLFERPTTTVWRLKR
ncbi:MAG: glycosyltransferase family 39 protein [Bacteroidota bacterium]